MAIQSIRIGSIDNVQQYDDADYDSAIETDQPMKAGTPVDANDVVRLEDLGQGVMTPLPVVNIDDPSTELNALEPPNPTTGGTLVVVFQADATGLDEYTIYVFDADDNAVAENVPYTVDAANAPGMWIAVAGKYQFGDKFHIGNIEIDAASELVLNQCTANQLLATDASKQVISIPYPFPIGGLFLTITSYANSAAVTAALGYGTWAKYAQGKVLISEDGGTYTAGAAGGTTTHTHAHTANQPVLAATGVTVAAHGSTNVAATPHTHVTGGVTSDANSAATGVTSGTVNTVTDPTHTHALGISDATNHLPPYMPIYIWRRVT